MQPDWFDTQHVLPEAGEPRWVSVRGAAYLVLLSSPELSGSGRAPRSTFPFAVSGSSARATNRAGTR